MHHLLLRLWSLPWPEWLRRVVDRLVRIRWLQGLVVPQFVVGVVGVIENGRGEILLLRHTYRAQHPWGLPSGFLEAGEQPADGLRREVREETGFDVTLESLLTVYTDSNRAHLTIAYRGRFAGGDFIPNVEVSEARFYPRTSLPPLLPEQHRMIEECCGKEVAY